jgi:glutathione S-transferase
MKLYYARGACSLAPHILLRATKLPFTLERVDTGTHKTEHDVDFYTLNPKGYVPLLELDNGERLSEGPVICQYICDLAKRTDLMPAGGTLPRYRVMEWQNYITAEIHKGYGPLFTPGFDAATKATFLAALHKKYEWVATQLAGKDYLTGATFTAADAYLFTVTRWAKYVKLDLSKLTDLQGFMQRAGELPAVLEAAKAEGIPG